MKYKHINNLSKSEIKLYEYLIRTDIKFMSMRDIALESKVSTATLSRLIHRLGYKSFKDFKYEYRKVTKKIESSYDFDEVIKCLESLDSDYYKSKLEEAASLLYEADMVVCYGIGKTRFVADYCARSLCSIGKLAISCQEPFNFKIIKKDSSGKRVNLVIFNAEDEVKIADMIMELKAIKDNSLIITITSSFTSTVNKLADLALSYSLLNNSQILNVTIVERLVSCLKKYVLNCYNYVTKK